MARQEKWRNYGLTPHEFRHASINPFRSHNILTDQEYTRTKITVEKCKTQNVDKNAKNARPQSAIEQVKNKIEERGGQFELSKMLLFEEKNRLYLVFFVFISILKLFSSMFYMAICANRHHSYDHMKEREVQEPIIVFEFFFFIEIVLQFFRQVTPDGQSKPLSSMGPIAKHYLRTKFIWHFIPIIPFQYIEVVNNNTNVYFLILKIIRMPDAMECYHVPSIMNFIKRRRQNHLKQIVERNPNYADDMILPATNHNIGQILIVKYILQTFRLVIIIFISSYTLGIFWMILCELQEVHDVQGHFTYKEHIVMLQENGTPKDRLEHPADPDEYFSERFIRYFGLEGADTVNRLIVLTYFAFTTLSTVGFGDFHPRSDLERFFCAFILLFGVACFSLIMGTFTEILNEF